MLQMLKESGVDYDQFVSGLTEMVKEMMGEEYSVRIYKVMKNNSLELDSLVILKEGKNFAPNIYLLPYYDSYLEGTTMNELAERLCNIYYSSTQPVAEESFNYTFDEMKSFIIYRLVSFEKNRKLLEKIPHIRFLDLAITFHCLVHNKSDGIGTIRITNEHMENWRTTLPEIHELAMKNTRKRFPPTIRSMDEVIRGMLFNETGNLEDLPKTLVDDLLNSPHSHNNHKMYILSNPQGINGATCILYENVIRKFSEKLHADLYILPSSIHEVILIPSESTISKKSLGEMVKDVNCTQVAADEVLSDKVYFYSWENNTISM